jgi:putative membrane protein
LALCFLPAFGQEHGKMAKSEMTDEAFVHFAAQTDMTEAHVGQLAQDQASSQAVKDYATMLTTDHTKDYTALTTAAGKAGIDVPKGLDKKHDEMIAPLAKLKGAAFDKRFTHEMVAGHTAAIAAYTHESQNGQNPALKAYATDALPVLEKHENDAKQLQTAKTTM